MHYYHALIITLCSVATNYTYYSLRNYITLTEQGYQRKGYSVASFKTTVFIVYKYIYTSFIQRKRNPSEMHHHRQYFSTIMIFWQAGACWLSACSPRSPAVKLKKLNHLWAHLVLSPPITSYIGMCALEFFYC